MFNRTVLQDSGSMHQGRLARCIGLDQTTALADMLPSLVNGVTFFPYSVTECLLHSVVLKDDVEIPVLYGDPIGDGPQYLLVDRTMFFGLFFHGMYLPPGMRC